LAVLCATAAVAQLGLGPNDRYACASPDDLIVAVPTAGAPALVNATLARFTNIAFRLCNDGYGAHYFLRAPEDPVNGVCIFYETEMFSPTDPKAVDANALDPNERNNRVRWFTPPKPWGGRRLGGQYPNIVGRHDPTEFMIEANGGCPALDDPDYVMVDNISAGIFKAVSHFWQGLASSQDRFNDALMKLAPALQCEMSPNEFIANRLRDFALTALRTALFDQHHPLRISNIYLCGAHGYYAVIEDPMTMRFYSAKFDLGDGGLHLECLGGAYVA
jgi:hypothetical protein